MKKKVLVIAKTLMNGGFGTQLFDEDPTCDCCFSKLNLDKSKVKKLIKFLVTEDEECKDVVITDVVISNSFIGSELNFGENNVYVFKEKHLIRTEPESDILNVVSSAKDEESTKQMCKILGVDYEEYKKFSKMMNKALEPMSKENLEKTLNNLSEDKSDLLIPETEMYISSVTLHDGSEYNIIENNVFKQPFLNILKDFHLTNGNDNDDLIIIKNTSADIRAIAEMVFKLTESKSITVIHFGDYYYISCNNSFKEMTYKEKNKMDEILLRYSDVELYIINK